MKTKLTTRLFVAALAACFVTSITLPDFLLAADERGNNIANAPSKWRDRSDELPGFVSTKSLVLLGTAIIGTFVILKSVSKNKAKKSKTEVKSAVSDSKSQHLGTAESSNATKVSKVETNSKVKPYFELNLLKADYLTNTKGKKFEVGLAISL